MGQRSFGLSKRFFEQGRELFEGFEFVLGLQRQLALQHSRERLVVAPIAIQIEQLGSRLGLLRAGLENFTVDTDRVFAFLAPVSPILGVAAAVLVAPIQTVHQCLGEAQLPADPVAVIAALFRAAATQQGQCLSAMG